MKAAFLRQKGFNFAGNDPRKAASLAYHYEQARQSGVVLFMPASFLQRHFHGFLKKRGTEPCPGKSVHHHQSLMETVVGNDVDETVFMPWLQHRGFCRIMGSSQERCQLAACRRLDFCSLGNSSLQFGIFIIRSVVRHAYEGTHCWIVSFYLFHTLFRYSVFLSFQGVNSSMRTSVHPPGALAPLIDC